MRKLFSVAAALLLLFSARQAQAWFDGGHMLIAYIAYQKLKPRTRSRVDRSFEAQSDVRDMGEASAEESTRSRCLHACGNLGRLYQAECV